MKKILICLALLTSALSALADSPLPPDVRKFVDRREGCDHMRGELPDSSEKRRMKEVNREIEKLCKGTDKQLAQLKKKYASNATVMQRLNAFEDGIEAQSPAAPAAKQKPKRQTG
ncbi:hypothetical protein [Massilia sp. 9096]|uniref:hypothetical protein n=1 Tax=Massilia sp. 9096 TaxID=1500894 RepID=UPI0012E01534|nr:hypothetical protein [Massilia sp. 9096]